MQQNIKGLLLLIFLIVFSFLSFQYFNDDAVETISVPPTTSTSITTVPVVEIESYVAPSFNFEELVSSSLLQIDVVCERTDAAVNEDNAYMGIIVIGS